MRNSSSPRIDSERRRKKTPRSPDIHFQQFSWPSMSIFAGLLLHSLVSFLSRPVLSFVRPYLLRNCEMGRDRPSPVPAMTSFFVSITPDMVGCTTSAAGGQTVMARTHLWGETVRTGCSLCHNPPPRQCPHHTKKSPPSWICFVIMELGPCEDREKKRGRMTK